MDEKQAIHRLKQGDIHGLEFLVHQFQVKAVRVAFLITRDAGLAEEVVQESFLKVQRSIRTFDENCPFEPWFLLSVVNASLKMIQRAARQVNMANEADESLFAELISRVEAVEEQVSIQTSKI